MTSALLLTLLTLLSAALYLLALNTASVIVYRLYASGQDCTARL